MLTAQLKGAEEK